MTEYYLNMKDTLYQWRDKFNTIIDMYNEISEIASNEEFISGSIDKMPNCEQVKNLISEINELTNINIFALSLSFPGATSSQTSKLINVVSVEENGLVPVPSNTSSIDTKFLIMNDNQLDFIGRNKKSSSDVSGYSTEYAFEEQVQNRILDKKPDTWFKEQNTTNPNIGSVAQQVSNSFSVNYLSYVHNNIIYYNTAPLNFSDAVDIELDNPNKQLFSSLFYHRYGKANIHAQMREAGSGGKSIPIGIPMVYSEWVAPDNCLITIDFTNWTHHFGFLGVGGFSYGTIGEYYSVAAATSTLPITFFNNKIYVPKGETLGIGELGLSGIETNYINYIGDVMPNPFTSPYIYFDTSQEIQKAIIMSRNIY